MKKTHIIPKYSEMLMELVEKFDEQLPEKLTFEETLEVGIDAWNLANNKDFLENKNLFKQELESYKNHSIIEKMVEYKIKHFPKHNNVIIDYETTNNILKVKTQENYFNNIMSQMINVKPKNDLNK